MIDLKRAEAKADATGHRAWVQADGSIKVARVTEPGKVHRVRYFVSGSFIHFTCTCPSGQQREHELIPCWACIVAGKRLVREGIAIRTEGGTFAPVLKQMTIDPEPDPLRGLPRA